MFNQDKNVYNKKCEKLPEGPNGQKRVLCVVTKGPYKTQGNVYKDEKTGQKVYESIETNAPPGLDKELEGALDAYIKKIDF